MEETPMYFPRMILFDYGHTLLDEPGFSTLRGNEALQRYIKVNRHNLTAEEINSFARKLSGELSSARQIGIEVHERQFQHLLYEYLGIELTITYEEAEEIFWDAASYGAFMPGVAEMLDNINEKGIRSGVISNIAFSGAALKKRISRLLPNHRFEFILASSEYGFRKPSCLLFELALRKAGLRAEEVWFCGDNVLADVEGAAAVGMFPVWYDEPAIENLFLGPSVGMAPTCEHLHIHAWSELKDVLDSLENQPTPPYSR